VFGTGSHGMGDVGSVQLRPVMDQVSTDELLSIMSRVGRVSALDSQHLKLAC
jgi:hypothetical protein